MKKTKSSDDSFSLLDNAKVTVTKMNHITEIQYMEKANGTATILKIDKDHYQDLKTGEIKEFKHTENRAENSNSLGKTFNKMRYLINYNFTGKQNELFITLTYAENMTDTKRLYSDTDKFFKRLKYRYKNESTIDYITVVEPQGRGAWHMHILIKFNDLNKIFIPNKELSDIWGQGYVTVKRIQGIDNVGAYLTAYLADLEYTEDNIKEVYLNDTEKKIEVIEKEVEGKKKKFIKGGRLHRYPTGMNYYRSSRGIKMPERIKTTYREAKKIAGSGTPHYTRKIDIEKDTFTNTLYYEQYNSKRKNRQ